MEYSRAKATDGSGWVYGYPVVVPTLPYPPEAPADDPQASPEPVMIGLMFPTDVSKYNGVSDWSEATTSVDINTIQRHIGVIGGIRLTCLKVISSRLIGIRLRTGTPF